MGEMAVGEKVVESGGTSSLVHRHLESESRAKPKLSENSQKRRTMAKFSRFAREI